jgi:hypothetical protein
MVFTAQTWPSNTPAARSGSRCKQFDVYSTSRHLRRAAAGDLQRTSVYFTKGTLPNPVQNLDAVLAVCLFFNHDVAIKSTRNLADFSTHVAYACDHLTHVGCDTRT